VVPLPRCADAELALGGSRGD